MPYIVNRTRGKYIPKGFKLMTVADYAKKHFYSESKVLKMIYKNRIKAIKIGGRWGILVKK